MQASSGTASCEVAIALPESLVAVLIASAGQLSQGHGITVLATELRLTPAEAGELLGLSRPFVARLLDSGEIPSERLPDSRHRLVRLADVLEFQMYRRSVLLSTNAQL